MNRILIAALFCLLTFSPAFAQKRKPLTKRNVSTANVLTEMQTAPAPPLNIENSVALQTLLTRAVSATVNKFADKNLTTNNLAVTLIDLRDAASPAQADVHGEIQIYPASVVKLFYLAAAEEWLERGKIKNTPELERGLRDMIINSSNDATGFIVDVLSGVGSGAELPEREFKIWTHKREGVQRYFDALGYNNINVKQKAFCEDAYGREQQFRGTDGSNRNKLTTNATARLLAEIVTGNSVSQTRSAAMMNLLKRNFNGETKDADDQAHGFTGIALNELNLKDAKLWSKAGWTSQTRHDAAYVETPDGQKFVLVVFTEKFANEREIIPFIARAVITELAKTK